MKKVWLGFGLAAAVAVVALLAVMHLRGDGMHRALRDSLPARPVGGHGATVVHVGPEVLRSHVIRLGVNLGAEDYYDSRQMLKNLVSRNPGFEGAEWQTILRCIGATSSTCTDATPETAWPEGFLDGGTYEDIFGAAKGQTGVIEHSTKADSSAGSTVIFAPGSKTPLAGDYFVVRKRMPGGDATGWSPYVEKGAAITSELKDLPPSTAGVQSLRLNAAQPGQFASITAFFDSTEGHSFVHMEGPYVLRFRAKGVSGNHGLSVALNRPSAKGTPLFEKTVPLTDSWQDYSFSFNAADPPGVVATAALGFSIFAGEVLLDDVSLAAVSTNGTAFRDEVVAALARLHPGVLRDMDSGQSFGSSLDSLLAPEGARLRSGFNLYANHADEISIGLPDFLVLSEKIGTEPWFTTPIGMTVQEGLNLMEFLGGPKGTRYGDRRIALGHPAPWTESFPVIHLEFGNEAWNIAQQGASFNDPKAYADRVTTIFRAMRASPYYSAGHFDLIANGQAVNPYFNRKIVELGDGFDTIDVAPYIFDNFHDASSIEAIFGPMFAQPEMWDCSKGGVIRMQAEVASTAKRPVKLAVYEAGMSTTTGNVNQQTLDETVPSVGAGLAAVDHMLLMLRDLGVTVQNTFQLAGFRYRFNNENKGAPEEASPIWGLVLDMGGLTNRVRPSFLAQQMANDAILPNMLTTTITGEDPTWDQPLSTNDKIKLDGAHELQTFAFSDGSTDSLILFNLSRTTPHSLRVAGEHAPHGLVQVETLTSGKITDGNELEDKVKIVKHEEHDVLADQTVFALPPFSMTVLMSPHNGNQPLAGKP